MTPLHQSEKVPSIKHDMTTDTKDDNVVHGDALNSPNAHSNSITIYPTATHNTEIHTTTATIHAEDNDYICDSILRSKVAFLLTGLY